MSETETKFEQVFRPLNSAEQKFSPKTIYCLGDLSLLEKGTRVSVIGSREASREGLIRARKLVKLLVERGITVVSGLAKGIDTAAHNAAIEFGGRTIAVLGTPLDVSYPKENQALQEQIATNHLVISQFSSEFPVTPKNFPIRNRLMALISDATIIVEAKEKSGSLHQGWEALRLARPLYILRSLVENASLTWPQEFLDYGAHILSDDTLEGLLNIFPESRPFESNVELSF